MNDILGKAILDFWEGDIKSKLWVHDHLGPKVEMKRAVYFRNWESMPALEREALNLCEGKILDVGAGAGAHTLELQKQHKDVSAIEISAISCEVMKKRGVKAVIHEDFFKFSSRTFDTILLIMNGVGISGDLAGFERLLSHCRQLLHPDGRIILDSSDLAYLYDKENPMPVDRYYGEIDCAYSYKGKMTDVFTWLYLDFELMKVICEKNGWKCNKVFDDGNDQFLAVLNLA